MFKNQMNPDEADGIEVLILKELASQLNFTVKYLCFNSWGSWMPNGSWSKEGMISALINGEADLAIGHVGQSFIAYRVMDLGPSISTGKITFIVRRPEQIDVQWETVLKIFKPVVWLSTVATFILVVVINKKIIDIYSNSSTQRWQQSVVTVFGNFLSTGFFTSDRTNRTRCLLTVWSVFCLLLTTCLSSGIVTKLTLPSYTARVDTLQQLVEQGYYWTAQFSKRYNNAKKAADFLFNKENTWARRYLSMYRQTSAEEEKRLLLWDRKITIPLKIEGGNLGVFYEEESLSEADLRQFRIAKESMLEYHVAFGVRKQLPKIFSESLAVMTLRFLEVGLIQFWKSDVLRRYPELDTRYLLEEHDVPVFKGPEPLPLSKLRPAFYLLFSGYAAATCAFIVEYLRSMIYIARYLCYTF